METHDIMHETISSFLDRFHPSREGDVTVLREIQQNLAAGQSLEDQYHNFLALADAELLRSFYESLPALREQILSHPNCPADLKPKPTSEHNGKHPLLDLDREIDLDLKGLADFEAALPPGPIDGASKAGCEARIRNLKNLFDRVPAVLHETDLTNNDNPLFYDLLMAKQRISSNQKWFTKLRIALSNRFVKAPEREEEQERSLLDQTPHAQPEEETPEEQPEEPAEEDLEEEALAALLAEEEAKAEQEAKAEKKAANEKRQQRLRESAKAQEERSIREQRQREEAGRESQHNPDPVHSADAPADAVILPYSYTPAPEPQIYSDQGEVLKRQEERRWDEATEEGERQRAETHARQQEDLRRYQERMERSRSYESFGKSHIDFSGKEQSGQGDTPLTEPDLSHSSEPAQPVYTAAQQEYVPSPETRSYEYPSDAQRYYEQGHREELSQPKEHPRSGNIADHRSDPPDKEIPGTPVDGPDRPVDPAQPAGTFAQQGYAPFPESRPYEYPSEAQRYYEQRRREELSQPEERPRSGNIADHRPDPPPHISYNEREDWVRKQQEHKESTLSHGQEHREQGVQDHSTRMGRPYEYQPRSHDQVDPPDRERHGTSPFQPYAYAPGGQIMPASATHNADTPPQSNPEIYRAAFAAGTITPQQSRAMRDNLTQLRQEYESSKGTASYDETARRYKEARDAVMAVNKDIRSNRITFDHGSVPATDVANVVPLRRTEQPDGFTVYNYTPTGVQGTSYQNGHRGGGVVVHNAPGTADKVVFSPEKPLLVTKAYEEHLYRDAQLARAQLKEKLNTPNAAGNPVKLSTAELTAYKTSLDAYEGFRRAKAEGLVQVTSAAGAHNTPNQHVWAARQETYRQTAEQYRHHRERQSESNNTFPHQNTPRDHRASIDQQANNRRYAPGEPVPNSKPYVVNEPTPKSRPNDANDFKPRPKPNDPNDPKPRPKPNDPNDPKPRPKPNDSNDPKPRPKPNDSNDPKPRPKPNVPKPKPKSNDFDVPPPNDSSGNNRRKANWNWKAAPFGSVFSINYNRGKYTTGEKETSSRLFNQDTKLRRMGTMRTMGSRLYQNYAMYAPEAGVMAGRKLYTMLQASSESASQSIRTFEQGRYYGTVGVGVAMAYATRNVGNLKGFEKKAAKSERQNFGFTRNLSDKDISKQLHTRMNESRSAKKDIRSMYERESGLSVEERRALAEKLKDHKAVGKDTAKLVGLQNSRVREKAQREILQELHRNPKGYGLVTENAIKDLEAQRQQIQQQRRAILKGQPERKALNKRLSELQKKGKENLSQAELNEIRDIRGKLSKLSSDPRLKALDRQEQQILKAFKKAPDDTAVPLKHIRLKDVQKLRSKILQDHDALERSKFAQFYKVKSSTIQANKKALEQQSEVAKRKVKALLAKGKRTAGEETELRQLRKLFKKNQADIKAHADILNLRNLRDQKIDALDRLRKALQKNKQRNRMGKMALIGLLTRPLQEGDSIGTQGLAKGISMGINPYVRGLVQSSFRATGRLTAFAAKKVGKWTGLDKTLAPAIDKTKEIYAGVRKIANTPREYQRKLVKTAVDATKRTAGKMTPQFIKTGYASVRKSFTTLTRHLQQSKLGKAYETMARALSQVKAMLGTAMKAVTAFIGKFLLIFLLIFLLVGLITVIGGGVGGSVPSFLIMGEESSGDKIDLKPYYDVIIDEWAEYQKDLKAKKKSGGYYKLTVNMDPQPANVRNILSMMAVRMSQDLDMDENKDLEPYLRSLTRDANPYTQVEGTCYCKGRDCTFYDCGHKADECPEDCPGGYYDCPGDHKTLTVNVKPLYFNEIFYADSSGNAKVNVESGELIGHFKITYYCLENYPHICNDGDSSTTADGSKPVANYTIATDPTIIETGTPVVIDGKTYIAQDTGGAIKGYRIDIAVATHDEALALGTRNNIPVYAGDYKGEGIQTSEEWNGWVAENREWAKVIYSAPWNELYTGIPNITDTVGNETDLSGVEFTDGTRPGYQAIVDSALSQVGNVGGEPYWSWYGFDSRVEWCATFVSWCADQQGVLGTAIPKFASCSLQGVPWFQNHNQWASADSDYTPVAGDIIFFDWQSDGRPDHVGIVVGSDGSKVYTVEGNSSDAVRTKSYNLNSSVLFGYGLPNY